jgi:DNA primase
MYFSPFRAETVPSFKVEYRKNLWYDFGAGVGGTMVDLVMKLNDCPFHQAMNILKGKAMPTFIAAPKPLDKSSKTVLHAVLPLCNHALISYLTRRGINTETAQNQCVEVRYSVGKKDYYAIGFKNDAGGYELRNRYYKGSVSPKDITTFPRPTQECMIFEGFMDYLSYLTIHEQIFPRMATVVLNSTAHLHKAMNFLNEYRLVHAYLDNDDAGKQALLEICREHNNVADLSLIYQQYKDYNKYLVETIKKQSLKNKKS